MSLPFPELALGVALGIHLVLEHAGHAVQLGPSRCGALVIDRTAVADRTVLLHRADALARPGGRLAALAHQHALPLAEQRAVWPQCRDVGAGVGGAHAIYRAGGLERGFHTRRAVDARQHSLRSDLADVISYAFAQHCMLLSTSVFHGTETNCGTNIVAAVTNRKPRGLFQ